MENYGHSGAVYGVCWGTKLITSLKTNSVATCGKKKKKDDKNQVNKF